MNTDFGIPNTNVDLYEPELEMLISSHTSFVKAIETGRFQFRPEVSQEQRDDTKSFHTKRAAELTQLFKSK